MSPARDLGVLITLGPSFKAFQRLTGQLSAVQHSLDENSTNLESMAPQALPGVTAEESKPTKQTPVAFHCWVLNCFFLPCPQLVIYLKCLPFCLHGLHVLFFPHDVAGAPSLPKACPDGLSCPWIAPTYFWLAVWLSLLFNLLMFTTQVKWKFLESYSNALSPSSPWCLAQSRVPCF